MGDDTARLPIESQLRVLPANVTVEVVQARNLPRGGILAPKAQVQVYCPFVEAPVAATEPSARNTAPSWNYTKAIKLRHHASSLPVLRFVVIDSLAPTVPLGTASLTVRAPATRGWLPLDGENSRADLFVVVRWNSCPIAYAPHLPEPPQVPDTNAVAGPELRTVDPRPGAIFRRGSFVVEVTAAGIPASVAQPWVCVRSRDQKLRGGETPDSRAWWKRKCEHIQLQSSADKTNDIQLPPAATPSASCDSVTDSLDAVDETDNTDNIAAAAAVNLEIAKVNLDIPREEDETIDPNDSSTHYAPIPPQNTSKRSAFKSRLSHARKSEHAGSLIKTVKNAKDKASTSFDTVSHIRPTRSAIGATVTAAKVRKKTIKKLRDKAVSPNSNTNASSAAGVASPPQTTPASVLQTLMAPRPRRAVDFGLFCFAEFAVEPPKCLYITVTDNDSRLPDALGAVLECELSLDILGSDGTSVVLAYCEAGPVRAKASVWVRVTRIAGYPDVCAYPAPVNVVTEKFMGLLENSEQLAADFKTTYPHAEGLTYLFVGGLFTNHYPLYFTRNVDYLQQKLLLPRVQCIPIHTESGLAANAKVIAASVAKTATRRNSVVLIGHSKGGCDILQAITHHIEIIPFIHGVISFQAPFLGTYAIDALKRTMLVDAIGSAIETLWHGQRESLLDMSYATRKASLYMFGNEDANDSVNGTNAMALKGIPIISVASHASFEIGKIRTAATAAGVASMSPIAAEITKNTGFFNDGLVVPADALIPFSDAIYLGDMMHTEPSLYVPGTKYPPGELTAAVLALLFDKAARGVNDNDNDANK